MTTPFVIEYLEVDPRALQAVIELSGDAYTVTRLVEMITKSAATYDKIETHAYICTVNKHGLALEDYKWSDWQQRAAERGDWSSNDDLQY